MPKRYFDEIEIGEEHETPGVTITDWHVMQFAGLSMDFFELHTNEEFAKQTQFGRRVAHGLMGLAITDGLKNRSEFQTHAIALEGALKLKEISYIHAEGYAAGELKHGPIALIDEDMPVVVIAPYDRIFDKTVSNMQEVAARGGRIILLTDPKGQEAAQIDAVETLLLPEMPSTITPMVYAIPVQLLAYHTAVFLGTDVDQPRNLAKSVTVE
jgi:hypothetical protein